MLEQTSLCVIDVSQKGDTQNKFPGQSKYVPWLVCMDSNGDKQATCDKAADIDTTAVNQCLKNDVAALVKQEISAGSKIRGTPTVYINGKNVKTSYRAIHKAICKADKTLKGCSAEMPDWADLEPDQGSWVPVVPSTTCHFQTVGVSPRRLVVAPAAFAFGFLFYISLIEKSSMYPFSKPLVATMARQLGGCLEPCRDSTTVT